MTLGYIGVGWLLFVQWNLWIPLVMPMLTLAFSAFLILLFHLVVEDKRRAFIKSAFEAYTSPEVVAEILQNIDDPALWGAKRRVTSLFVDIRGFTTLTEKVPPEIIVEILNEYYQTAVEAIRRHGGIPNKFIGDEIMALFNAPRTLENSEEAACRAAIDIQLSIARLNTEKLRPNLGQEITCGVGVNTGEVIVGIVGKEKIEYTALGDDVNIASRLQGRARPGQVLIGQATYEALRRGSAKIFETQIREVRRIPEIVLKGLTRKFDVYELCYERGQNDRT
jgi:class 3 adenylate cyclase